MSKDIYGSLDELKSHTVEGVDYKEFIENRGSSITILSIHGGVVEWGTSELAKEIAKEDLDYYNFEALNREKRRDFHVTSHKFYQKDLEDMLKSSDTAVSIHGCVVDDDREDIVCVGGLNDKLKSFITESLTDAGFEVDFEHFPATYYNNVVNRAKNGGVQLELTYPLRKKIFSNLESNERKPNENFYCFTNAVRSALDKYLESS